MCGKRSYVVGCRPWCTCWKPNVLDLLDVLLFSLQCCHFVSLGWSARGERWGRDPNRFCPPSPRGCPQPRGEDDVRNHSEDDVCNLYGRERQLIEETSQYSEKSEVVVAL